jgi:phosphoribosylanthranilate isomerase
MNRVRVKICGITSLKDLLVAVKAGADAVGFVIDVPSSPRNLTINGAKELIEATPTFVETVAVTVFKGTSHLEDISRELSPSAIQVHGSNNLHKETRERLLNTRLIGAFQAKSSQEIDAITKAADTFDIVLLDSYVPDKYGGSGVTNDWELSKLVKEAVYPKPLILAGGLKPENVKEAISVVRPYAVDVSSGVESSPGVKDRKKVFTFIKNVKEAEI